jgi:hypothetical protein
MVAFSKAEALPLHAESSCAFLLLMTYARQGTHACVPKPGVDDRPGETLRRAGTNRENVFPHFDLIFFHLSGGFAPLNPPYFVLGFWNFVGSTVQPTPFLFRGYELRIRCYFLTNAPFQGGTLES